VTVESTDVCAPTVTDHFSLRPVPGTVVHVMARCGVVTAQAAVNSMPEGP